jgi:hypothetical protein
MTLLRREFKWNADVMQRKRTEAAWEEFSSVPRNLAFSDSLAPKRSLESPHWSAIQPTWGAAAGVGRGHNQLEDRHGDHDLPHPAPRSARARRRCG